ncbi:polycystin-1-like protein 2 [Ptychodera flava]|uniref:polycystin-1-like protein 2 n=1 Tax=Ptychodera flava TaxID=63121 RepID=UPI00396AA3CF
MRVAFGTILTMTSGLRSRTRCTVYLLWLLFVDSVDACQTTEDIPGCSFYDNTDMYGSDLLYQQLSSYGECCTACAERDWCKSWTYVKSGINARTCALKHNIPERRESSSAMSGIMQDSEKPVIICPPNITRNIFLDMATIQLSWTPPNASDNSGTVHVSGSHQPGCNFTIGLTTVSYKAVDPSGNKACCMFTVTVKGMTRPFFDDSNGIRANSSTHNIINKIDELSDAISGLVNVNVSAEESQHMAEDMLQVLNDGISLLQNNADEIDIPITNADMLTKSVLNVTDHLATFLLRAIKPGSGPVIFETPSIRLDLESDSVEKLTNGSLMVGGGNGFKLPSTESLFTNMGLQTTVNRVVKVFKWRSFNFGNRALENDVLSLSFTDRGSNVLEVNSTAEDIGITFGSESPEIDSYVGVDGVYLEVNDVTYFGWTLNILHLFHAVIIHFNVSKAIYGNTTAYIFNEVVEYSTNYRGYLFGFDVQFSGEHTSIFIPEHDIMEARGYYLTFAIPQRNDLKISMTVQHTKCGYMKDVSGTWNSDGCKVSPSSNMTSTTCLCNHLTSFTATTATEQ